VKTALEIATQVTAGLAALTIVAWAGVGKSTLVNHWLRGMGAHDYASAELPRIQRGNASFADKVLGARGALLSVLVHFFEHGSWKSPLEMGFEEQRLTVEDQLFRLATI
jgi:hypothetical protein